MDIVALFQRLLELSPFVAALFFFLYKVWNSFTKKDEALITIMREHAGNMLQMQKENITAQNNNAEANRSLAGSIDKLREHFSDGQADVLTAVRSINPTKPRNGKPVTANARPLPPISTGPANA